jgi:hypothetical protein
MTTANDVQQLLSNIGLTALGIESPRLAIRWVAGVDPGEGAAATMSLTSSDEWVAPAAGVFIKTGGTVGITMPDGSPAPTTAAMLRLFPQVVIRLARLIASVIEGRTDDRPVRPVPVYFVYTNVTELGTVESGLVMADDPLRISGTLTIHDQNGLPIDPVAVAGEFDALVGHFDVLEARALLTTPPTTNRQITTIAQLGAAGKRARLVDPHGQPNDGAQLTGLTAVAAPQGLFSVAGTSIGKATGAPEHLRLGPATNGTLDTSFAVPNPASSVTLHRDFFSVMVVDLQPFLIGARPDDDAAANVEARPDIRHDETMTFSFNGNAMLGAANQILSGTPNDSLVVSPVIQGDFAIPTDASDSNAQWPSFPAGLPTTNDPILAALLDALNPTATFITGTDADVALTLNGLTPGQAVRVYNRQFLPDAREGRGDGAGAAVPASGTVTLVLKDPLGLVQRGLQIELPTEATLHVDLVVVNSQKKARVFGNVTARVDPPAAPPSLPAETNPFGTATDRGTSSSGLLGLPAPNLPPSPIASLDDIINLALNLGDTGAAVRESPRLPTMARRDTIVAANVNGTFRGQISGVFLNPSARNALSRIGSPGSPGGPEFHGTSAQTQSGRLGYDLARAALRRTRGIAERLAVLAESRWDSPAAATGGTISGAILQTVAPVAETPEFTPFGSQLDNLPATWTALVDSVVNGNSLSGLPAAFRNQLQTQLNNLRNSAAGNRLYDEFKRDFSASVHGRRDALWALKRALSSARELIYIEGPAFTPTAYGASPDNDLVTIIGNRLTARPDLRLVLALPKQLDYGPGYEVFAAREIAQRKEVIDHLKTLAVVHVGDQEIERVVAFHPIGFPGRPLRLATNIVIVDDVWAMIGTSTIRRRGLTFDGGVDVVLFDRSIRDGHGAAIGDLRRRLMAEHLGMQPPAAGEVAQANWVQLNDGLSAFNAINQLLDQGGAGLIEPLWDGRIPGVPPISPSSFPSDDVADPEGRAFNTAVALIVAALSSVATPPLLP